MGAVAPAQLASTMNNTFTKVPSFDPLPDGVMWESDGVMTYTDPWGSKIAIPKGFHSDFASIPNLSQIGLLFLLGFLTLSQFFCPALFMCLALFPAWVVWIAEDFLHEGTWDCPAFLHDYLYATRCRTFWQSNWILFVAMRAKGCASTPTWKRCIIFAGVTLGGYFAWVDDKRKLVSRV